MFRFRDPDCALSIAGCSHEKHADITSVDVLVEPVCHKPGTDAACQQLLSALLAHDELDVPQFEDQRICHADIQNP